MPWCAGAGLGARPCTQSRAFFHPNKSTKKKKTQQQKNRALFWTCHLAMAWRHRRRVNGTPGGAISVNGDGGGSSLVRVAGWWGLGCRRHPRLGLAACGYAPGLPGSGAAPKFRAGFATGFRRPLRPNFGPVAPGGPRPAVRGGVERGPVSRHLNLREQAIVSGNYVCQKLRKTKQTHCETMKSQYF